MLDLHHVTAGKGFFFLKKSIFTMKLFTIVVHLLYSLKYFVIYNQIKKDLIIAVIFEK